MTDQAREEAAGEVSVADRLQQAWDSWPFGMPPIIFTDAEAAHLAAAFVPAPPAEIAAGEARQAAADLQAFATLIERPPLDDVRLEQDAALRVAAAVRTILTTHVPRVTPEQWADAMDERDPTGLTTARALGLIEGDGSVAFPAPAAEIAAGTDVAGLREALADIARRDRIREWTATEDNPESHWVERPGPYARIAEVALSPAIAADAREGE